MRLFSFAPVSRGLIRKIILRAALIVLPAAFGMADAANAAFTDLKFSRYQIADVPSWNVSNCTTTTTCEINLKNPGTAYRIPFSNGQVDWQSGQYVAFVPSGDSSYPLAMTLFNADGSVAETLGTGRVLTAGQDEAGDSYFFFIGNDEWTGQLFSGSFGMNSSAPVTITGTLSPTLAQLETFSVGLATQPLEEGQSVTDLPQNDPVVVTGADDEIAQMSVLERVMILIDGSTNLARINGTFVNIAENAGAGGIDGSILNIVEGVRTATQVSIANATAIEYDLPTLNWGNMSTTVLGAVNTGEISLGLNAAVEDAMTRSTRAMQIDLVQIGGSDATGALVLNVASNMTGVNGRIQNNMMAVNGTIGSLSTTTLGAVNTGTITSGVNGVVQGIVGQTSGS